MADDEDPKAGEVVTANYGWTKPTVGASDDQWGGYLNADLDGIDTTVNSVSTVANAAYPASNPAGYITAAAIPAPYVLPTASTSLLGGVKVDGSTIAINSGVISAGGASITVSDTPPSSPSAGALWFNSAAGSGGGQLYVFYADPNTSQWVPTTNQMGGGYATTAYVNSLPVIGDNRLINGDMRIDQRNNGASGTANSYTVDRWQYGASQANKGTWGQNLNAVARQVSFPYYLGFQSSSAYTMTASDYFRILQIFEADMISDFAWGTASAQSVTLSFWAYSSLTGVFGGALQNSAGNRSYPFSFSIPTANTWTKISVTIPGDTGGTWTPSGNGVGCYLIFDLGCGSTYRGPANVWASASYMGVTGSVSVVGTNGATFYLTGVKLETGTVATPYNRQSLAKSLADCQRYYCDVANGGSAPAYQIAMYTSGAGSITSGMIFLPVVMRALPTLVQRNQTYSLCSAVNLGIVSAGTIATFLTATAGGVPYCNFNMTASAEL